MRIFAALATSLVATTAVSAGTFGGPTAAFAAITPGSKIPYVDMDWGFPPKKVNMVEHLMGRNVLVVGLPGAFTPT